MEQRPCRFESLPALLVMMLKKEVFIMYDPEELDDDELTLMYYPALNCVGCRYSYIYSEWVGNTSISEHKHSCYLLFQGKEPKIDKKTYYCSSFEKENTCV